MSSSLRARITTALAFAGGSFLYFSDHETLSRNWRVALGLGLGAVVLALSPLWRPTCSTRRTAQCLVFALTAISVGGCGASRSGLRTGAAIAAPAVPGGPSCRTARG